MKRLTEIGILILGLMIIAAPVVAQHQQEEKAGQGKMMGMSGSMMCPMMQSMGGGMIQDPVCKILHEFGSPGFYTKYAEELGLSDEQVKKLDAIWFDHKKIGISKKAELEIAQLELKKILSQQPADFKKAKAKIAQIGSLEDALRLDHLQSIEKARNILTVDQIKKFSELKKGGMKMMKGMMQGKMKEMMEGMGKGKKAEPEK